MIFKNKNALDMIKRLLTIFVCTFLFTYNYYQILSHQVQNCYVNRKNLILINECKN